jgi:hypothetical protein
MLRQKLYGTEKNSDFHQNGVEYFTFCILLSAHVYKKFIFYMVAG